MSVNAYEPITQEAFLHELNDTWTRVEQTMHDVQQRGHAGLQDDAGWTPLDHLAHLSMWAQSVLGMVRSGKPQWEGLGVPRDMLEQSLAGGDLDQLNELIRKQTVNWSLERVQEHFAETHRDLMQAVAGLDDKALLQPSFAYADGGGDAPMLHKLRSNTSVHYTEHCDYIDRLLAADTE